MNGWDLRSLLKSEGREKFLNDPNTWKFLFLRSDSVKKLIETNKDYLSERIEKKIILPSKTINNDLIPLVTGLLEAASNDGNTIASKIPSLIKTLISPAPIINKDVTHSNQTDIPKLLEGVFNLIESKELTDFLIKNETIEKFGRIILRTYDNQSELQKSLGNVGISRGMPEKLGQVGKVLFKNAINNGDNRKVLLDIVKQFIPPSIEGKGEAKPLDIPQLFDNISKLLKDQNIAKELASEGSANAIGSVLTSVLSSVLDLNKIMDKTLVNGLNPVLSGVIQSLDPSVYDSVSTIIKTLTPSDPANKEGIDSNILLNKIFNLAKNKNLTYTLTQDENIATFGKIIQSVYDKTPDLQKSLKTIGIEKENLEKLGQVGKVLFKNTMGNDDTLAPIFNIVKQLIPSSIGGNDPAKKEDKSLDVPEFFGNVLSLLKDENIRTTLSAKENADLIGYSFASVLSSLTNLDNVVDTKLLKGLAPVLSGVIQSLGNTELHDNALNLTKELANPDPNHKMDIWNVLENSVALCNNEKIRKELADSHVNAITDVVTSVCKKLPVLKNLKVSEELVKNTVPVVLDLINKSIIENNGTDFKEIVFALKDFVTAPQAQAEDLFKVIDKTLELSKKENVKKVLQDNILPFLESNKKDIAKVIDTIVTNNPMAKQLGIEGEKIVDIVSNPQTLKKIITCYEAYKNNHTTKLIKIGITALTDKNVRDVALKVGWKLLGMKFKEKFVPDFLRR